MNNKYKFAIVIVIPILLPLLIIMRFGKKVYINIYSVIIILIITVSTDAVANFSANKKLININDSIISNNLRIHKKRIEKYKKKLQYDSAYISYKQYVRLRDSLYKSDRINTINNLTTKYKLTESEAQSKFLSQKLRNRTLILILSIFLVLLIILLIALTYSRYSIKAKLHQEEAKDLNLTIEQKNQELISRVLHQNHQNEIYEEINTTIASLERDDDIDKLKQYLNNINLSLSNKNNSNIEWESFKNQFEQVHPLFFNKLLALKSNLTENDLKICAYIKLNLTTKDIANILNLSYRTVQTTRYRIKKKLELPQETDLMRFIQGL